MTKSKDVHVSVLLMLAEAADENVSQLCPRDMANQFRPPVPFRKLEIAADHLVELGYAKAIEYELASTDYRITQKGLEWVEEHFARLDDANGNTSWTELRMGELPTERPLSTSPHNVHIHNTFTPQNIFQPANQNAVSQPSLTESKVALWGTWGTWVGVFIAVLAIIASFYLAGKL